MKTILNIKKIAFKNKNSEERRKVQEELRAIIRKGKEEYIIIKNFKTIEKNFESNSMKRVCEGMNVLSKP